MQYDFPAIFFQDGDMFSVRFPDEKSILTCAKTLSEAIEMAEDALNFTLLDMEEENELIPTPSKIEDLKLAGGQTVRMIHADTEKYARELELLRQKEDALKNENPIKYAREKAGLSLKELSDLLGAPYATIVDWNNGRRTPPVWLQNLIVKEIQSAV